MEFISNYLVRLRSGLSHENSSNQADTSFALYTGAAMLGKKKGLPMNCSDKVGSIKFGIRVVEFKVSKLVETDTC